jgi:hypothetical protein
MMQKRTIWTHHQFTRWTADFYEKPKEEQIVSFISRTLSHHAKYCIKVDRVNYIKVEAKQMNGRFRDLRHRTPSFLIVALSRVSCGRTLRSSIFVAALEANATATGAFQPTPFLRLQCRQE